MRILCTNDDGILAHGLDCLVRAAQQIGDVTVVAPDREQSSTTRCARWRAASAATRWMARRPTA